MKRILKTSLLQKSFILLALGASFLAPSVLAEWGVDQVLEVQIFEGPKGLPENVYYLEHQIRYQGPLEQGLANGEGKLFWNNGKVLYEGGFVGGLFEGKGLYRDRNGFRIYQGEFNQGRFHGTGTLYSSDGSRVIHEGLFEQGAPR
ncbi:MAG TPA: hypothetical protein QF887_14275 [SAR324 cluster bacterium]|jgi:hypothetical protein|nr:hypothetical protein [Deltaproteobacteria bacterium]HJM07553.1 hypothetical protein [SAR324 cluster bacterium]|tara:strand:+ start:2978 stop:3415 length:438 start_codon:yes stop_codon:yes gene_type:complete